MLSRISIGCDETSRQVLPRTEEAAQAGTIPPGIPVLIPCSAPEEYGLTRMEWRENFGAGVSKRRGWFGTEAKPCWLCCSIRAAPIQRFSVEAQMFSPARPGCNGTAH